jgi:hypothetical protein
LQGADRVVPDEYESEQQVDRLDQGVQEAENTESAKDECQPGRHRPIEESPAGVTFKEFKFTQLGSPLAQGKRELEGGAVPDGKDLRNLMLGMKFEQ